MEDLNIKGTLFNYMKPEDIKDEMRNGEGLYQMRVDPADNTDVFLLGALIEDYGSMCYVVEIEYKMYSTSMPTVVTPSPHILREKFSRGQYHKLQKKVHIYQIKKRNPKESDYYTVGKSEFSRSIKDVFSINDVVETRAEFGISAKDNRIVKTAINMFKL